MGEENIAALQGQELMRGKSASGHYFSGEECNFKVFQGILQGQRKSRVFQGLPGFVGQPNQRTASRKNVSKGNIQRHFLVSS